MSTRPTYRESECKVKELEMEREFFQEAISAVSHFYYAIDADAIELQGDHFNQPVCYSWTHKRSTPSIGRLQLAQRELKAAAVCLRATFNE